MKARIKVDLRLGDCLGTLRGLESDSVDALVTDPPYGLSEAPDALQLLQDWMTEGHHDHAKPGFMGRAWDSMVPGPAVWREVLRVLKPGAHGAVFSATRTVDLLGLSLRLAGFEVRDVLMWVNGRSMPKGSNVSKALDRALGQERRVIGDHANPYTITDTDCPWNQGQEPQRTAPKVTLASSPIARLYEGFHTSLKSLHEPIVLVRKPLVGSIADNVLEHGTGAINIDACREGTGESWSGGGDLSANKPVVTVYGQGIHSVSSGSHAMGRYPANVLLSHAEGCKPWGTHEGLEAWECVPGCPVAEMDAQAGADFSGGGPSRFFYCPKASSGERFFYCTHHDQVLPYTDRRAHQACDRFHHPTVKPEALMAWLVRLLIPPTDSPLVLDPFMGSGTTGVAAIKEKARFLGCELDPHAMAIARHRTTEAYLG